MDWFDTVFVTFVAISVIWIVVSRERDVRRDRAELRAAREELRYLRLTPEERMEEMRERIRNMDFGEDEEAHEFMLKDDEGKMIDDFIDYRNKDKE